jgi:serine/threonine protein kinase
MHRNINPDNINISKDKQTQKVKLVKLGGFDYSIFIEDNDSMSVGSLFYKAPEMIKNIKYDEKCDLWSFGITLYELYFGQLPYGTNKDISLLKKTIYNGKKFILKKSNIPTLDFLFERLLVIDRNIE